jgi:hypothetical protein
MHIESLEDLICQTMENMIIEKIHEQIFDINNDFENEEDGEIQRENQLLASHIEALLNELQHKIKIKVGQSFHHGMWSAWRYDGDTRTLIVGLGKLYHACDKHQQIVDILLHFDIGLLKTLILQTRSICSLSSFRSKRKRIQ